MKKTARHIDRPLLILLAVLVVGGALVFASAAFGFLVRGNNAVSSVAFNHLVFGVGLGLVALLITSTIDYKHWRKYALWLFIASCIVTALVFIPGLGMMHGGGKRWINIFSLSFQPSETLKIGATLIAAAYFSMVQPSLQSIRYSLGGLAAILAIPIALLLLQPDLGTLSIIVGSVLAIYIAAGAPWRHILIVICIVPIALGVLAFMRPYVKDRIVTFFYPSQNQHAEGYQIRQSLIAIGSGGFAGRGFGQGVQKFTYLPEPMGDSIFAVVGEELGFIGSVTVLFLFLGFALRGFNIAARSPDAFGALLAIGIATYLGGEAFINIGAMLGVAPLTGIPLTFVSQGGSAMLMSLASAGILLNVSRYSVHS